MTPLPGKGFSIFCKSKKKSHDELEADHVSPNKVLNFSDSLSLSLKTFISNEFPTLFYLPGAQKTPVMWWATSPATVGFLSNFSAEEEKVPLTALAQGSVDAQGLSRGATVAISGHIMGPISSTSCSFGTFIGIGGWGGTAGFGGWFLVPHRRSRMTDRQLLSGCSLESSDRLHNGVYNFGKKNWISIVRSGQSVSH